MALLEVAAMEEVPMEEVAAMEEVQLLAVLWAAQLEAVHPTVNLAMVALELVMVAMESSLAGIEQLVGWKLDIAQVPSLLVALQCLQPNGQKVVLMLLPN